MWVNPSKQRRWLLERQRGHFRDLSLSARFNDESRQFVVVYHRAKPTRTQHQRELVHRNQGVNCIGTITATSLLTCTCTSSFMSHGRWRSCTRLYACTQPLELCSAGWSKFPRHSSPPPPDSSLTAESHSEQSSGSNCHKKEKETCLSGWKQQSQ